MGITSSDLLNGHNSYHIERFLQSLSNALDKNNSGFHILIPNNSVFLVILLHLHSDIVNKICDFIDGHFFRTFMDDIVELDQHAC